MSTNQIEFLSLSLKQAQKDFVLKENDRGFIIAGPAKGKAHGYNYSEIQIPHRIADRPVFKIADNAFESCDNLQTISIPEGVEEIGDEAFAYCTGLCRINFPSSLRKIGNAAFEYCTNLNEIEIPKGVTELGIGLFMGNANLTSIVVDPENPVYDSRGGCNAIIETKTNTLHSGCPTTVIPGDIVALGNRCFADVLLKAITIPEGVTEIGECAFSHYEYNKIRFKSALAKVSLPKSLKTIEKSAFESQKKLKKLVLPEGLSVIGEGAFSRTGLEQIVIPESITRLEDYMFTGCEKLMKIYIPESVTFFGKYLFEIGVMSAKAGVIEGKAGSAAEKYAKKKKITFVAR